MRLSCDYRSRQAHRAGGLALGACRFATRWRRSFAGGRSFRAVSNFSLMSINRAGMHSRTVGCIPELSRRRHAMATTAPELEPAPYSHDDYACRDFGALHQLAQDHGRTRQPARQALRRLKTAFAGGGTVMRTVSAKGRRVEGANDFDEAIHADPVRNDSPFVEYRGLRTRWGTAAGQGNIARAVRPLSRDWQDRPEPEQASTTVSQLQRNQALRQ